jgi:diacylglycerol kinase (CTP)
LPLQIHKHEVPRKLLHVSIGFLAIYLYRHGHQPARLLPPLTTALIPIATADLLRFYSRSFNALYIRLLGALMRESEVRGWNGVVWYLVGTITVLAIFPKDVATLSILLLSWCDTAASTFGRLWGRYTPSLRRGKSLAGSLAAAVVGALSAAMWWGCVVPGTQSFPDDPVGGVMWAGRLGIGSAEISGGLALAAMSILTGIVASASEVLDAWGLDDNVVIPVVSAVGVWGILKVFG